METCGGSLSAPPLAVSAATVLGQEAVPSLLSYATGDVGARDSSNRIVAAVLESLGHACPEVPIDAKDRESARPDAFGRPDDRRSRTRQLTGHDIRRTGRAGAANSRSRPGIIRQTAVRQ